MFKIHPEFALHALVHDLAKVEATRLRREAIDAFWRGEDFTRVTKLDSSMRSAQRLAYRLARHRLGRDDPTPTTMTGA